MVSSTKGGNILIPIVYFPDKDHSEIDTLKKYKSGITWGRPTSERAEIELLKEEPIPGFELPRLFNRE
jgi:hypothetical protein